MESSTAAWVATWAEMARIANKRLTPTEAFEISGLVMNKVRLEHPGSKRAVEICSIVVDLAKGWIDMSEDEVQQILSRNEMEGQ